MKIAIIAPDNTRLDNLEEFQRSGRLAHQIMLLIDGTNQLVQAAEQERPDMIIAANLIRDAADFAKLEQVSLRHPELALVLLSENVTPELLHAAMHIGVKEVLPLTVSAKDLLLLIERIGQKMAQRNAPQSQGKVLAFISPKGGSGSTFLATNLGYFLAKELKQRVALVDMHAQFGDALLFVSDKVPTNTLPDVIADTSRLDASLLKSSMIEVLPNFGILAASDNPEHSADIKPSHIEVLLNLTRNEYDFTILDIGRYFDANSIKSLDHADLIYIVMQETLPHIRDAKAMLSTMQTLGYDLNKIRLVINRYIGSGSIQLDDIAHTLKIKVYKTCPNNFKAVSASVNQGVPILEIAGKSNVARFLKEVADELVLPPGDKKGGWLSNLFEGH